MIETKKFPLSIIFVELNRLKTWYLTLPKLKPDLIMTDEVGSEEFVTQSWRHF